jgi:SAM-dependent methyltransferase
VTRFWDQVAGLPGLSPVIDYQAEETTWARYINALHLHALARSMKALPTDRVLDFGCGVGRIASWLAPQVAQVIGVDTSPAMIEEATRRNLHPNVRFQLVDDQGLSSLPVEECDIAIAIWVMQHILDDGLFHRAIDGVARAVRPGAHLFTLDRLCREPLDHGESDYLRLRTLDEYEHAFFDRGLTLVASHPVAINEQVLDRPGLTRWIKGRGLGWPAWLVRKMAALDMAWARRQREPLMADYLFHFWRSGSGP